MENNNILKHEHECGVSGGHHHSASFKEELLHHLPYAIFSVALSMIVLALMSSDSVSVLEHVHDCDSCTGGNNKFYLLFHSFHFLHILFAATGTVITFSRFSKSFFKAVIVGTVSPIVFCMLSDVLLPNLAGKILGVDMDLHICFHRELPNVLPFLLVGIINGFVLRKHHSSALRFFSLGSHFVHILISSLASLFYMVSHGFSDWSPKMGIIFLFLVVAIVVPCTFSDVVVPMYFAKRGKK